MAYDWSYLDEVTVPVNNTQQSTPTEDKPKWELRPADRFTASIQSTAGSFWGLAGAMADSVGLDKARDWSINRAKELFEKAADKDLVNTSFKDVMDDPIKVGQYAAEILVEQVPFMIGTAGAGGAARYGAMKLAETAPVKATVENFVHKSFASNLKEISEKYGEKIGKEEAYKMALKSTAGDTGAMLGAVGFEGGQMVGQSYLYDVDKRGADNASPLAAYGVGLAGAALAMLSPVDKMLAGRMPKGKSSILGMSVNEASQEIGQELVTIAHEAGIDPNMTFGDIISTDAGAARLLDSGAAGALLGGIFGSGARLNNRLRNKPEQKKDSSGILDTQQNTPWQETLDKLRTKEEVKDVVTNKPEGLLSVHGIDTSQDVKDPMTGDIFKGLFAKPAQIEPITDLGNSNVPIRDIPVADTTNNVPIWRKVEANDNLNAQMDSQVQSYQENQLAPPSYPAPSSPIASPIQPAALVRDISQDTSTTRPLWDTPEARRRIAAANEIDRFFPPGRYGQVQGALFDPEGTIVDVSGQSVKEAISTALGKKTEAVVQAKQKVQKTTNLKQKVAARKSLQAAQKDLSSTQKEATVLAEQTGPTIDLTSTPILSAVVKPAITLSPETQKILAASEEKVGPTTSQEQQVQEQSNIASTIQESTKGKKVPSGWTTSTAKVEGKEKTIYTKDSFRGIKKNDKSYILAEKNEDGDIVHYGSFKSLSDMTKASETKQVSTEFYKKEEKPVVTLTKEQMDLVASVNQDKIAGIAQQSTSTFDNQEAYDAAIKGIHSAAKKFVPGGKATFETYATGNAKFAIRDYLKKAGKTTSLDASSKASEGSERDSKISQVTKEQIEDAVPLKVQKSKVQEAPTEVKKVEVSQEEETNLLRRIQEKRARDEKTKGNKEGQGKREGLLASEKKEDISPSLQKDLDQIAPEITYQGSSKMLGKDIHQFITSDGRNFSTLTLDPKEIQEKYNKIQEKYKDKESPGLTKQFEKPEERVALKKEFLKKATSADRLLKFTDLVDMHLEGKGVTKSVRVITKYLVDNLASKLNKIPVRDSSEYAGIGTKHPSQLPMAFYVDGVIYLNKGYFTINGDHSVLAEAAIHEVIHAVTVKEMEANPEIKARVTELLGRVRSEVLTTEELALLKDKYNFDPIRINARKAEFSKDFGRLSDDVYYGLLNEKEFLSQAFSSKQFQEELKRINLEKPKDTLRTIWDKFVNVLRDVLGMTNSDQYTALDEALSLGTYLFKTDASTGKLESVGTKKYASNISPTFFKCLPVDYENIGLTSSWKENKKILIPLAKALGFVPHRINNSQYYELDDSKSTINYDKVVEGSTVYLNDLLDHYSLFETDSTLKGIKVVFTNQDEIMSSARKENLRISDDLTKKTILGAAYGRKIYINLKGIEKFKGKENTKLENVLIHEVQHLLSSADNEGIARETQARLSLNKEERAKTKPDFEKYWYTSSFLTEEDLSSAISPALEKQRSTKTWDERAEIIGKSTGLVERLKNTGSSFKEFGKNIAQVSSDVLRGIDDRILKPMRAFEMKIAESNVSARSQIKGFYDGFKKISEYDRNLLGLTLYNTDPENVAKRNEILKKNGLVEEYKKVEKLLKDIHNGKEELGINEFDEIENWFPRRLKDYDGLIKAMRDDTSYNIIQAELDSLEKNKVSKEDKEHVIKSILNTGRYPAIAFKKGTSDKQRKVFKISSEWMKYYANPMESLLQHIYESNEQLAAHSMFSDTKPRYEKVVRRRLLWGKLYSDDKAIGKGKAAELTTEQREAIVSEIESIEANLNDKEKSFDKIDTLLAEIAPELEPKDARTAINVIRARLTQKGMVGPMSNIRNVTLMAAMGSPTSAITQITDFALNTWVNGGKNTIKALFGKKLITAKDLDLEHSMKEFQTEGTAKWLDKILTLSGMKYMDLLGKEVFIQGAINKAKEQTLEVFSKKWKHYLGESTEQTYKDIQADKNTELTRFFAFNALSDWQPISLLEMPMKYNTAGNNRIFYALKSYNIKQLNNFYRESVMAWRNAETTKERLNIGRRLGSLLIMLTIAGAATDDLKDFLLGKDANSFGDHLHNNILKLAFMSRYTLDQGFKKGFFETMLKDILLPPLSVADDPFKDIISWFGDKPDFQTIQNLPWGRIPYNWLSPVAEEKDYSKIKSKVVKKIAEGSSPSEYRKEIDSYNSWATNHKEKPITYGNLMAARRKYIKDHRDK